MAPGDLSLYADSVLVFRLLYLGAGAEANALYIPSEWEVDLTADVSGSAAAVPWEVGTWDVSTKDLYLAVRDARVLRFDCENQVIEGGAWDLLTAAPTVMPSPASWARFTDSLLSVFDVGTERPVVWWETQYDGDTQIAVDVDMSLNQAAVEAL